MPDPRSPQSCLWNLRIKDRWYRCRDPETLAVCEIDRPEALNKIKQICDQPDKLDEWEEAPFPAPLSSESGLVYTINMDAGTLDVAYFKKTEYSTHPRTNRYDLRAVYEASSWPSAICLERPQPLPAQQDSGKVMDDELAQPPLEPLHLELDFPTPVNVLQTRLYVNFLSVWRWHFLDSTTWSYDSRALNYFCFAILRLAAWDLEVSCPEDNIYWYHGFLVVLHDSLEDQSKIRSAIQRAREYLERTTAARRRRHTRLIIMSPYHIVFAEITPDDTVRASSSSRLLLTSTGHSQRSGFRALCGILTSNCWPDTTAYREIWRNYLPWEIILHILSHLEPHDMAAFAQVSVPVKMMYYASLRQTIPQFASLTMLGYEPLIDCCGTRSGLEQSGVMCTVCYSCKHTGCLSVPHVASHNSIRAPVTSAICRTGTSTWFNTTMRANVSHSSETSASVRNIFRILPVGGTSTSRFGLMALFQGWRMACTAGIVYSRIGFNIMLSFFFLSS
ncbi:hypothetical protein ASPBRDRAFT_135014 [Aspergillus brasiliensis CBS 101740]|uniref:F-box domain-containing protein n=1 Tax=Aspergillus brasiliensis (strain CBS 101740 / IMI 381727 / IBT 21946) TaxID=767769 RepID=A0A1L9U789_ASPBC|nr:hypothetical protein ASPBRDRAFT_135014 [Aspergillus brasiliensis CBS 101740]